MPAGTTYQASLNVYEFVDYRCYLREFYALKKKTSRSFSFRLFSELAGMKSPNHLKRVIDGDRNLSDHSSRRYVRALQLEGEEADYFLTLVRFSQATSHESRYEHYQRIVGFRGYRRANVLELMHADFHAKWYIPVIRGMMVWPTFIDDADWVANKLRPTISVKDVRHALHVLSELKLAEKRDGKWYQSEAVVTTGPQAQAAIVGQYHRDTLIRSKDALDEIVATERDFSALTLALSDDGIRIVRQRIAALRKELIALSLKEEAQNNVVHIGFQLYPMATDKNQSGNKS